MGVTDPFDQLILEGNQLEDSGEVDAALALYRRAEVLRPAHPRVSLNVANALQKAGRLDEAAETLRQALQVTPNFAPAHFNLAAVLVAQDALEDAEAELRSALQSDPGMSDAAVRLAAVLESLGRYEESEVELRRAIAIHPDNAGAVLNLGALYLRTERIAEAEEWIDRAGAMDPGLAAVHSQRGGLYLKTGRYEEAYSAFTTGAALDPSEISVGSGLLFSLNFRPEIDPVAIAHEHRRIARAITAAGGRPFDSWQSTRDPDRRLRIGYVSGDLRQHPVGLFMRPVVSHHDHRQFEIHCFANQTGGDPVTESIRPFVDHWHAISQQSDTQVARLIHDRAIDILVDLTGHTDRHRLGVFVRKPAPVQATWLGYLNTTGLPAMDYRICDRFTDPVGESEHLHTERLFRMPFSQWCYAPFFQLPVVDVPHAERPGKIVFGSFNQLGKISNACLDLWCRILARLPDAELTVFDVAEGATRDQFSRRLVERGIDLHRVRLRPRGNIHAYCNAISNVDIALDTFPYNGGTTTLDILWMSTPIVALRGDRGISRSSFSIISSLGIPELVACSHDEYVEINVRLATDQAWRGHLRASLRQRLSESPLMDGARFTADLERGYRTMWTEYCSSRPQ